MERIWAFIISKELSKEELNNISSRGIEFVNSWTAHTKKLSAVFEIYKSRIILIRVSEQTHGASGCSIDKLNHFIKDLEKDFSVELMNRLLVALKINDLVEVVPSSKIREMLSDKKITENTIVYNTWLSNSDELKEWEQPLKNTWLKKYL